MRIAVGLLAVGLATASGARAQPDTGGAFDVQPGAVALQGLGSDWKVRLREPIEVPSEGVPWRVKDSGTGEVLASGRLAAEEQAPDGELTLPDVELSETGSRRVQVELDGIGVATSTVRVIPGWLSLLPPLIAIGLALWIRQVVLALVAGVWLGAFFVEGYAPVQALLRTADEYAVGALSQGSHTSIIIFTLLLGGMVNVITRSGGGAGLARIVTRRASTSSQGQLATWLLGLVIFFDDYANSLLVGSSMRPISDRLRVSREKLAFLVDATAAPVASIAVVSSWIGVEVGYIADQYDKLGLSGDPYIVFLQTIPYRFYPLLMLFFGLLLVLWRRDFGPMRRAEHRARTEGKLLRAGARPASEFGDEAATTEPGGRGAWANAVLPIVAVVGVAIAGMYVTGRAGAVAEGLEPTARNVFGNADSLKALLWGSLAGGAVAVALAVARRVLSLGVALDAWLDGLKAMVLACVILVLAWSLGEVCEQLHTAGFIVSGIGDWLAPPLLPAVVFVVAALVSFATGTSWGTMAILFPLVVPMAYQLAPEQGAVLLSSVGSILAGAVWGDHCSPISDTTIMSSLASSCDHIDHVRTQLPYALLVGIVSLLVGEIAVGFGLYPAWVGLLVGMALLTLLVRLLGCPTPEHVPDRS
jgi:Na+/H+ antiporter NhaC